MGTHHGSILWRRLDTPGHDACRVIGLADGWQVEGTAVFQEAGQAAQLSYRVEVDVAWRTRQGDVHGWIGARSVAFRVARTEVGEWRLNGSAVPDVRSCTDLDLGFTPATNILQLRRLDLVPGQGADAPVAWLDVSAGTLEVLNQRYERRTDSAYWYEAPRFQYAALLTVNSVGFILRYPGLWDAES